MFVKVRFFLLFSIAILNPMGSIASKRAFDSNFDLSELDGLNGIEITNNSANESMEFTVSHAGDINDDGIDDFIIGSLRANDLTGRSYVIFGKNDELISGFDLSSINENVGFIINGVNTGDALGLAVSYAGDINHDGIDDIVVGSPQASSNLSGKSYVIFGSNSGFGNVVDLTKLNGNNGFEIRGQNTGDLSGFSVSHAGDINNDGIDDLVIGAVNFNSKGNINTGAAFVVFGSDSKFNFFMNLSELNGNNGFVINGVNRGDHTGYSVSHAGDFNGDGIDDVVIGAYRADPNSKNSAGICYLVYGNSLGFNSSFDLLDIDGSNGFLINGSDSDDMLGHSVSDAGDLNGDGYDDIVLSAPGADSSYVVFGTATQYKDALEVSDLNGANGFEITASISNGQSNQSVDHAGDVNGDGVDDLIIGASVTYPNASGSSYVIFGKRTPFNSNFNVLLLDGSNGFAINGANERDFSGHSVSFAGDINNDGIDDIIIGTYKQELFPKTETSGSNYLVFGNDLIHLAGFESTE